MWHDSRYLTGNGVSMPTSCSFATAPPNAFPNISGDEATSKLLSNTFWTIGFEQLSGGHRVFINFTTDLLRRRVPAMFPNHQLVVEILEDVAPHPDVVAACRHLAAQGYTLALDDFFYKTELKPLIHLANIIKIDFRAASPESSRQLIEVLTPRGVAFLAEKVETVEEFQQACDLGYRYFQGYFFARPEVLQSRDIAPSKLNLMMIMAEVNRDDIAMDKVARQVLGDVSISYKLLRYINSAYFRRVQEISSIRQALALLGEREVRRFVSLVAAADLADGKPSELIRTAIVRARFCELLGNMTAGRSEGAELFILGLFSLIDAMLDQSMDHIVAPLPLAEPVKQALTADAGDLATYLRLVKAYERMDAGNIATCCRDLKIDEARLPSLYFDALGWASGFDQNDRA